MIVKKFFYFIKIALHNIYKRKIINLISLLTIIVSFFVVSVYILAVININKVITRLENSIEIIAYLSDKTTDKEVEDIIHRIANYQEIREVRYISKEMAIEILRKDLEGKTGILEGLALNPLPASIEIALKSNFQDMSGIKRIVKKLRRIKGISDVEYGQKWIDRFYNIATMVKFGGLVFGGILIVGSVMMISGTIRLTLTSKKEEIEIMGLIGATNWFIKIPFIIEGAIQGVIGSLCAVLLTYLSYDFIKLKMGIEYLSLLNTIKLGFLSDKFIVLLILSGLLIGIVGSSISLGRFFRL
ncbi:MAG: permease-like cell division protein FtsX [Thermodesulfobacteriota bacterium]|nr:permease-like cell division protein FtsX [Thermodesulfobacteriota bacterium]